MGRNAVADACKMGNIDRIYISENVKFDNKIDEIVDLLKEKKIHYEFVQKDVVDKMSGEYKNHQGIAALCRKLPKVELADFLDSVEERENVCLVVITEIEYEQNLGAILRTLDAAGVDGIIAHNRIKNTDTVVVKKISMGASESIPMFSQSVFIAAKMLKEKGYRIIGIESGEDKLYLNENLRGKIALVFGGENKSLSEPVQKACDEIVSIPMLGIVTSLNVSVSVGLIVYERLRQIVKQTS